MKRYLVKQFNGCALDEGYVHNRIEKFLNSNPDYILDQISSSTINSYITVVVVMKLRED